LLAHSSVRVAEKGYASWMRARQEQLEADVGPAWASDPISLGETKGTTEVHGKKELAN